MTRMESLYHSAYYKGVLLIVISAVTFSSAGLFTKGVSAGAWEVIFWRGAFAALFTFCWIKKRGSIADNFSGMGPSGWAVSIIAALGTAAFIQSFKLTSIANVSLIYASSPLIAALLAWVVIGEKASQRTLAGCLGALMGVAIIVFGSLGNVRLIGDLLALCMTSAMAVIMIIYRKYPSTPAAGPAVVASLLLLPFSTLFGNPFLVAHKEITILAVFGLLFALASVTLAEGAKHVPSGKTALLSTLETPLAPILAFLLLSEIPTTATLAGGSIVLLAVLLSLNDGTK